ncbi:MAG: hypothetical protein KIT84_20385 [Labilithrix sp.]|nr:hypothetical protein [Labilithrix sp.]MCW5813398.1 hypothetical protein [Labilithrix sp.]
MTSSFLRAGASASLAVATLLVAACSGSDLSTDLETGTSSSGGRRSSSSGTSGTGGWWSGSSGVSPGYPGHPGTSGGWSSSSGAIDGGPAFVDRLDLGSVRTITVGKDVCGKPPGTCLDAQSFTVDFDKGTVTHTTCVEIATPDAGPFGGKTTNAETTKPIADVQLKGVYEALGEVRLSPEGFNGFDGPIDTLEVTTRSGETRLYSPFAGCSQDRFTKMTEGFEGLWQSVSTL